MSNPSHSKDQLDQAFQALRSRDATISDSFSQDLEDQLMVKQEQLSRRSRWSVTRCIVLVLCTLVVSAAAVGYAVENDLLELPWTKTTFSIDDDGIVTDESDNVVGQTSENEDGTFTTTIRLEPQEEGQEPEIRATTDKPLNGREIMIFRPKVE